MNPANNNASHNDGLTLRQAALIAGFGYLLSPVTTAEFSIMPKLVIPGKIEQTVQNIGAHHGLFAIAIFCYLITFLEDIVLAWALFYLLARSVARCHCLPRGSGWCIPRLFSLPC